MGCILPEHSFTRQLNKRENSAFLHHYESVLCERKRSFLFKTVGSTYEVYTNRFFRKTREECGMKAISGIGKRGTLCLLAVAMIMLVSLPQEGFSLGIFDAGVSFDVSAPSGDYSDYLDKNGYGAAAHILYRPIPLVPFKLGLEVGYSDFGSDEQSFTWDNTHNVSLNTETKLYSGHLLMRMQQGIGGIAPYVEGLVGFTSLRTTNTIESTPALSFGDLPTNPEYNVTNFSYGIGGGIWIEIFKLVPVVGPSLNLDIKVRYLSSGNTDMLSPAAIDIPQGMLTPDEVEVGTLKYQVGIVLSF